MLLVHLIIAANLFRPIYMIQDNKCLISIIKKKKKKNFTCIKMHSAATNLLSQIELFFF